MCEKTTPSNCTPLCCGNGYLNRGTRNTKVIIHQHYSKFAYFLLDLSIFSDFDLEQNVPNPFSPGTTGVYFCRTTEDKFFQTKKMLLLE